MLSREFLQDFNEVINPDGRDLIFEFFITFSRFECALINTPEFRNMRNNKVTANWDRFTSSINFQFNRYKTEELDRAVDYLVTHPPKIRSVNDNQLTWRDRNIPEGTLLTNELGLHIRTIRNNLFHGGKFNGVYEPEISRNDILIRNALVILNEWLLLNQTVQNNFLERLQ